MISFAKHQFAIMAHGVEKVVEDFCHGGVGLRHIAFGLEAAEICNRQELIHLRNRLLEMMNQITYTPIGTIHSPFTKPEGMPIQPSAGQGIKGHILIHEEFVEGLADLEGFSHIYLLFHLHLSDSYRLKVTPFLDDKLRGVFSTRAPSRPNPIGLSVVKLIRVEGNRLDIENVDMIDGTPLVDIKPYVPEMEEAGNIKIGWLSRHVKDIDARKSDRRFT